MPYNFKNIFSSPFKTSKKSKNSKLSASGNKAWNMFSDALNKGDELTVFVNIIGIFYSLFGDLGRFFPESINPFPQVIIVTLLLTLLVVKLTLNKKESSILKLKSRLMLYKMKEKYRGIRLGKNGTSAARPYKMKEKFKGTRAKGRRR